MTLTFPWTSVDPGPTSTALKFYIYSVEIAIPPRLMLIPVFHTGPPRWKINSFLSEISVCWSCTEKITIKIERAFSVISVTASSCRRSFQQSPQQTQDLMHNWQLQMQDGAQVVHNYYYLLAPTFINRGRDHRIVGKLVTPHGKLESGSP